VDDLDPSMVEELLYVILPGGNTLLHALANDKED
jgi:hypothetical protein